LLPQGSDIRRFGNPLPRQPPRFGPHLSQIRLSPTNRAALNSHVRPPGARDIERVLGADQHVDRPLRSGTVVGRIARIAILHGDDHRHRRSQVGQRRPRRRVVSGPAGRCRRTRLTSLGMTSLGRKGGSGEAQQGSRHGGTRQVGKTCHAGILARSGPRRGRVGHHTRACGGPSPARRCPLRQGEGADRGAGPHVLQLRHLLVARSARGDHHEGLAAGLVGGGRRDDRVGRGCLP